MALSAGTYCEVNLNTNRCEHPPGLANVEADPIRTRCYVCGQRTCKTCSKIRAHPFAKPTRVRVCNDCAEEYQT